MSELVVSGINAGDNQVTAKLFFKHKKNGQNEKEEAYDVVPLNFFFQIKHSKGCEYQQRDHFLDGFQLKGIKFQGANAVRWYGNAVLEKRNTPANQHYFPKRRIVKFEVPVPGRGHK